MPRFQVDDPNQQQAPQFEELPEGGMFVATLTGIDERRHQRRDGSGDIVFLDWTFILERDIAGDDHFAGRKVRGSTLAVLKTAGGDLDRKFHQWASNILGEELTAGHPLDTDDLIGLEVQVEIGYEPDRRDPNKRWARAFDVRAADGSTANPWHVGTGVGAGNQDPPF